MNNAMQYLKKIIEEDNGNPSSMRLMGMVIVISIMIVWVVLSIKTGAPVQFDNNDLWMIGMVIGGKGVQKFFEDKKKE